MKRILLDQGIAPRTAILLRAENWDAIHVSEAGLDRATDAEILDFARQTGRTCVTLDHDFHTHLALAGSAAPSVAFIRVEGLVTAAQAELILAVWKECESALDDGAAVSVDQRSIRVRRLPLR